MKKRLFFQIAGLLLFCLVPLGGNAAEKGRTMRVSTGLPPIAFLARRVGGECVSVHSLLPEGRSPHDYVPGPRDIRALSLARLFLTTGMTFEEKASKPLAGKVKIVDITKGIRRLPVVLSSHKESEHSAHDQQHAHHHGHDAYDPHVWLSPVNAAMIAENICSAFCAAMPERKAVFQQNLVLLQDELAQCQKELTQIFGPYRGRTFYVYHPAFGYFAAAAGLKQSAVELEGREVSGARLAEVIRQAQREGVTVIFVQPQFNPGSARALARAINGEVAELDPLAADLTANFRKMISTLQKGLAEK